MHASLFILIVTWWWLIISRGIHDALTMLRASERYGGALGEQVQPTTSKELTGLGGTAQLA